MSKLSQKQLDELKALSALPDTAIDSTDIPETADWTKAVRGRFHRPEIAARVPVYLEADLMEFLSERADRRRIDTASLVNELLRKDVELIRAAG